MFDCSNVLDIFPDLPSGPKTADCEWRYGHLSSEDQRRFLCRLAMVAKGPIVEFGTFTGRTTYALALNTDQQIYTIDLGTHPEYEEYVVGEMFLGKPEATRIHQILGDSATLDLSGIMDAALVFIDGEHRGAVPLSDTRNALAMLAPDGLIVWDDWGWADVARAIETVEERQPVAKLLHEQLAIAGAPVTAWARQRRLWC